MPNRDARLTDIVLSFTKLIVKFLPMMMVGGVICKILSCPESCIVVRPVMMLATSAIDDSINAESILVADFGAIA